MAAPKLHRISTAQAFPNPDIIQSNYKRVHTILNKAKSSQDEQLIVEAHKALFSLEEEISNNASTITNTTPLTGATTIPPHTSNIEEKVELLIELAELAKQPALISIANSAVDNIIGYA